MRKFIRKHTSLGMVLVLFVFLIMLGSLIVIGGITVILVQLGIYNPFQGHASPIPPLLMMLLFSIAVGTILAAIVSRRSVKPLRDLIEATHKVATGDFTVQLEVDGIPEMEDLTRSFNTMVTELASIETLRSDFISSFSHEFKTPIVSIRGFAKLLRNKDLPDAEREEYIEIIIQESERLAGLSTNVLELTKLENTGILANRAYFFLDEQVRRVAALMEPRWRKKDITVKLEMDSVTICCDEDLLQQVWVNLLDNAVKFTPEGGHIAIALKRVDNQARLSITDDGCGMDETAQAHLFDKFYQGDKSRSTAGNGLGLSLVKRIVTLCGGEIEVQSTPGKGSAFTVTLACDPD